MNLVGTHFSSNRKTDGSSMKRAAAAGETSAARAFNGEALSLPWGEAGVGSSSLSPTRGPRVRTKRLRPEGSVS